MVFDSNIPGKYIRVNCTHSKYPLYSTIFLVTYGFNSSERNISLPVFDHLTLVMNPEDISIPFKLIDKLLNAEIIKIDPKRVFFLAWFREKEVSVFNIHGLQINKYTIKTSRNLPSIQEVIDSMNLRIFLGEY